VSEVVRAKVRFAGTLERGDPDELAPILSAHVAAFGVGEDERVRVGATEREVQLGEFGGD
jgi:hypothetical protein